MVSEDSTSNVMVLPCERFHENLHTAAETKDQMKGRFFLNVVIRKCSAVLELLSGKNETLLIGRNALLVLNLRLHIVDGVRGLDLQRDRLPCEHFHEDLHAATKTKNLRKIHELQETLCKRFGIPRWR